jgi:TP901 family phage tail tape measure protein
LADVNSNININFNTAAALAQLRQLQAGLSKFHQSLAEGNLAAANAQKGLNAQLLQSLGATGKFSASQVKVAGSTLAFTSALEKNKLSLREYYRYTMAAATANTRVMGRAFAQEREIINRARRDRVKALQAQYIQMNKANAGFMDAIRIMPKNLQMASGRFTELGARIQYAAQRQQFLNQLLKQGSTQLLNFGKNTQWAGRQLMVGLTMPLALFGASAAKAFRELETEIVKFKRVYGTAVTNDAEVNAAVENIRKLATEYTKYGVSVTKTMEMAGTAAAAGFAGAALNTQVETATKLAVLGQVEQQQALETTMSLQNAFGLSSEELAKKIDFLNAVENQTVLSIEDLTIAIPKAAPVIKQLGGNVEDLAFFMTAMKEGGINASEGANALKSGLASLINPSKKAAGFLADLGINVKGIVEANQGDIKATVIGFAQALDTLDPLNRARAIEQMFGKFQFARLSTLFQNVAKDGTQASRALDLAGSTIEELAVLSEREMKKIEDSVGVKFQAAIEQFKQEIMPLGKAFLEALTPVVKFFGNIFEKFNGLSDQTKKVVAVIVGVVAGLGPVLLMTFGLLANGVANVIKFFAMLRGGIAKLNGQTSVMGAGFNYMTQEQIESAAASQQLHQTHTRLIEVFNVEKVSVNNLAASYHALSTQMRTMAAQNPSLFAGGVPGARRAVSKLPPVKKYAEGILSVPGPKGAGDVVPAMLSPGEAVIPTDTTNKYRGLISAMFQDKVPGFMAGRLPGGPGRGIPLSDGPAAVRKAQQAKYRRRDDARQGYNEPHPEVPTGPVFVGMPKSSDKTSQSRQIVEKISDQVSVGRFGTLPPSNFGTLLQPFSGRSFPVQGVGGIYRKPNGKIVVVKPTIDEKTALAEVRATEIARQVHGLVAPKQSIRTMIDPTDPSGQRKFIVIESPYDPRIAAMDGKFSKSDMVKQLVASTLRGDKDLQQPNLSGNVLADVGTAGVFDRASGFRDFSKAMPSMEEQAVVNLLGVKGGAKKFFAQETSGVAASMTPKQYDDAIKGEINSSIPKLERLIKSWSGDLNPEEQVVYNNMLERLKAGAKVHWDELHPVHARASEGVKKLALGDFEKFKNIPESQRQISTLRKGLAAQAARDFKQLPEEQQRRVLDAIAKQKMNARTPAVIGPQTLEDYLSQSNMLKFVDEELIYKDGLYHDKKTLDAGRVYGRTYEEVMQKVFYQMGVRQKDGEFVSDKKINAASRLRNAVSPVGKESGSWRGNVPRDSELYQVLDAEEKAFTEQNKIAGKNDPLKPVREKLVALGYKPKEIDTALRTELSHISKTGKPGKGPAKWLTGSAMFDLGILNKFMNASVRHGKILDWSAKNGHPFIPKNQIGIYTEAAEFMSKGGHPTNEREARLVQKAAELDVLAQQYKDSEAKAGRKPKRFPKLGPAKTAKGVLAVLDDRFGTKYYSSPQPEFNLKSGSDKTLPVLVNPDGSETKMTIDPKTKRVIRTEKLTDSNTTAAKAGAVPSSGSRKDSRGTSLTPNQTVVTRRQFANFRRGFASVPGFSMPGMATGDPRFDSQADRPMPNPTVRQGRVAADLRAKGYSQDEIDKVLRKVAKDEAKLAKGKSESVTQQVRNQKLDDADRRRQTNEARARFRKQQHLSNLNYNQARYYQEALDEDERRKLNNLKQSQKQDAQARKNKIKEKRDYRAQKVGVASGGLAMGLGMAGSAMMMSGNTSGGMAMLGASTVAGMAPMLAGMGPTGWVTTAIVAAGAGLFLLNKHFENSAKKQAQYVDSISATTNKMDEIGKITDKVGASRAMDEVRKKGSFGSYNDVERAGTGFGDTFLRSEIGKKMVDGFVKEMSKSGSQAAAKDFALQLSTYVSDGVLDAAQAADIADQIGVQLGSRKYTADIVGNLREVIGVNGEDLANNPLKVRMQIVQETNKRSDRVIDAMNKNYSPMSMDGGRTEAAQLAALSVNNISVAKAQADATEFQYRKQIQLLEKELESTSNAEKLLKIKEKIAGLEEKMADDMVVANNAVVVQMDREKKRFKDNIQNVDSFKSNKKETAYFSSLKSKVKDTYKGTGFETSVGTTLEKLAKLSDKTLKLGDGNATKGGFKTQMAAQDFEVDMSLLLANKVLNPDQMDTFLLMFEGKLPELSQTLKVGMQRQGAGPTIEILEYFSAFKDGDAAATISTKIINSDKKTFNEIGETLAVLRVLDGHEINMEAFLSMKDSDGKPIGYDMLVKLSQDLKTIDGMPKKIDKAIILDYFVNGKGKGMKGMTESNLEVLFSKWKDFDKLPDFAQKEAVSKFKTIMETVFADEASRLAFYSKYAQKATGGDTTATGHLTSLMYNAKNADETLVDRVAASTKTYIGENGEVVVNSSGNADSGGGSGAGNDPLAFLAPLAMALKNVRDNAFNALTPVKSLLELLKDNKTKKNAFTLFDGIQHRLLKLGVGQELRDAVASMSAEDFAKVAALPKDKAMFTFEKGKPRSKDSISGLGPLGEATDKAIKAKDLGNFDIANATIIKDIENQTKAYAILVGSGLSAAKALEVVADTGQAAAIAAGAIDTSSPAWQTYINNIKTANTELERQAVLNKAIKANEEFGLYAKMPELVSKMKELGYSTDQIDAVLGDPELAKFLVEDLKDGKLEAKEIAETLNNIEARKIIDIQILLNKGALKEASDKGREVVDELFAAQEALIRTGPEAMQLKGNQRQIRDLEGQIAPFQRRIAELNDEIEDGQRVIEESYTRPIEDLNEEINDLNRDLEMNPFFGDRAIKKIQDENTMLSNDLEIINHAADEVNKRYDEQAEALSKVQEINQNILDQQKQQLGLADALTQGDISAAAQAAQDMRATSASQFASGQSDALEQARKNALGSLVGPQSGLTQDQISEKQFQNAQAIYRMETDPRRLEILKQIQDKQDEIYKKEELREAALRKIRDLEDKIWNIEENSIEPLQERIDALNYTNKLLQDSIDKQIEGLRVLGKTRDEWDRINAMLDMDAATKRALAQSADLAALLSAAETLNMTWADILAKMAQYANGIPGAVQNAMNQIGGVGAEAYVAPQETQATISEAEKFDNTVQALDAAIAAYESAVASGNMYRVRNAGIALAAIQSAYDATLPEVDPNAKPGGGLTGKYGMLYQADGGFIPKGTDTVPAMLTPGEFVVRKSAVDQYGQDFLNDINVQRFSTGGTVGAPHGLGMSSMGSRSTNTQDERATSLFDKKIWEKTANFFSLPSIAKTALDIAKYGGIPQMFAAKAMGAETKSSLKDNLNAALAVAPVPGLKAVKPAINKLGSIIPKTIKESLGKNGIDIFNKILNKANAVTTTKPNTSLVEEKLTTNTNTVSSKESNMDDWGSWDSDNWVMPKQPWDTRLGMKIQGMNPIRNKIANAVYSPRRFFENLSPKISQAWRLGEKEPTINNSFLSTKLGSLVAAKVAPTVADLGKALNPKRLIDTPLDERSYLQRSMVSGENGKKTASYGNAFKNIASDITSPITSRFNKVKDSATNFLIGKYEKTNFGRNMSLSRQIADVGGDNADELVKHYKTQAILDSIPGGLGALIQMKRGIHRHGKLIEDLPSPLERFLASKFDGAKTPMNAYGPGLYSATSPATSKQFFNTFGDNQYGIDLTPKAMFKVLTSKGFIDPPKMAKYKENYIKTTGTQPRDMGNINADTTDPFMQSLMRDGYIGYRHGDAYTNWGVGNIPGMRLKFKDGPDLKAVVKDGKTVFVPRTDIPKIVEPNLNNTQKIGTNKSLIAKASALAAAITGLSLFKTSEARADEYFPPKPKSAYDSDNKPTGSPTSRYWGELERLHQQSPLGFDTKGKPIFNDAGKDPWGGTEIPGLPFNGKVANFSDYFHQLAEQPKKSISNPMDVDKSLRPLVGSGASMGGSGNGFYGLQMFSKGGLVPKYFAEGGYASGTDTVPAMLTPGEFVMSRYAVQSHGADTMRAINSGQSAGDSVYNYSISVNVKSDANPDEIARVVMTQIKGIDSQKLRGNRL